MQLNPEIVFSGFRLAAPYSAVLWLIQPKFGSAANLVDGLQASICTTDLLTAAEERLVRDGIIEKGPQQI